MEKNYENIDEAFVPVHEYVENMIGENLQLTDQDSGTEMKIDTISLEMPIQLDVLAGDDEEVTVGITPPVYYYRTSFMPAFHKLKLTLKVEEDGR